MKLLLIEDETAVISLIQRLLKYDKFEITVKKDGASGLQVAQV